MMSDAQPSLKVAAQTELLGMRDGAALVKLTTRLAARGASAVDVNNRVFSVRKVVVALGLTAVVECRRPATA
jgi:hypothetical protein